MSIYRQDNNNNNFNQPYRYQNSNQQFHPTYIRKPLNYVDQYTNDRIPLNYNKYVQNSTIDRLHEDSNPTQFFNNPEYSTNDLFLRNQIPNQEEAVIKQKIDNEWNIRTQFVTINVDSRARDFNTSDYENFLEDDRNEVSVQGMWLSSYIFPNNFKFNFNKQYANIKTVKLTSAVFPNTRSRNVIYIDDTNNHFFVSTVMKCPWLSFNFHINQTTNLFDFQNFAFSVSDVYINLYKFFQEIEQPYGIPRKITDTTINNYPVTTADMIACNYIFEGFNESEDWMWLGNRTFTVNINNLNMIEYFATTQSAIVFDNGNNYKCEFRPITVITNLSNSGKSPYDEYVFDHYINHAYNDLTMQRLSLYSFFDVYITHTIPEFITISFVSRFPDVLEDNYIYILGELSDGKIIPASDVVQNGISMSFNRNTFKQLRGYSYTCHYTLGIRQDEMNTFTNNLDVVYTFDYIDVIPSMITGSVSNIESASQTNFFLMKGTINGQLYFNNIDVSKMLCAVIDAQWMSENNTNIDTLDGYTTGVPIMSTEFGWQNYIPVSGLVTYVTMSAGVLNNINFYTQFDESTGNENTKYYGTFVQGVPSIIGNSLTQTASYVTRAIEQYFQNNNLDFSTFRWSYTNDLFMSGDTVSKVVIPYGEYTLDELIATISQQPIKVKSVKNIITSVNNIDYIENVNDNSRYYFFTVVQFQCKLLVTMEYYKNSYLLKFEIDNDSIQPLQEEIQISAYGYTHTFVPDTVLYDIKCLHLSKYNATGEIIFQNFFTLDPFYFHQETNPEISYVKTIENTPYTKYNYSYNVKQFVYNDELTLLEFFPAPIYMYNRVSVFPVNCTVSISPASEMIGDPAEGYRDKFTLFKILPDLPEGFKLEGTTITGSSPIPFESIHYVYFYYYAGEEFRYYQQIKLINAGFKYNYSTVKLLSGYRFKGVQQQIIDSNIIATPYTNISVQLDKNWTELSNETDQFVLNIIDIGDGISIGHLTGDIYGTPESEFQMTLNLTAEYNYANYGYADVGSMTITDPDGNELSSIHKYIQSTSVDLYSVNADRFYGDNSFMIYSYNYVTDTDNDIPQFVCWAKPIKNEINNFLSFHIFANDVISTKLLNELHFSYSNSKDLVKTRYLLDYYQPTQVLTMEQTQLPSIRAWTTSEYTENIIDHQYANTTLLNQYSIAENAVIYPLRQGVFGYATSNTRNINLYCYNDNNINIFNPDSNDILSRIWYAIPGYVKNELNGYIFSQHYATKWVESTNINGIECQLFYPENSFSIQPITNVVNRIDPTTTQYANILDMSLALSDNIDSSNISVYKYCLYNRCSMTYDIIYEPVNVNRTLYNNITVPDTFSNNNLLGVQVAARMNKITPIVDQILSEYDYYNFEDFIWIQLYSDNYGEFENIFDPLTNRWYFAKIFFKRCEKRHDVSFNYFECPLYLCKNLNYIQELNSLQVKIFDKFGKLYNDYNSTHYDFSFTLDIEYFIDDIRANGMSSRRPTQDNVVYSNELMAMQRINGKK